MMKSTGQPTRIRAGSRSIVTAIPRTNERQQKKSQFQPLSTGGGRAKVGLTHPVEVIEESEYVVSRHQSKYDPGRCFHFSSEFRICVPSDSLDSRKSRRSVSVRKKKKKGIIQFESKNDGAYYNEHSQVNPINAERKLPRSALRA